MRDHDCQVCIYKKLYEKRTCYLYEEFPDGTPGHVMGDSYDVPRLAVDGQFMKDDQGHLAVERRFLDSKEFLDVLWRLNESLPHLSAWQILNGYFKEVCPTAFGDPILSSLINAQSAFADYNLDFSSDEIRTEVLGFYMTLSDTLEAFDIIVGARNAYERYEQERIEKEAQKRNKG